MSLFHPLADKQQDIDVPMAKETQSPLAKTAPASKALKGQEAKRVQEIGQVKAIRKPVQPAIKGIKEDVVPKFGVKVDNEEDMEKVGLFINNIRRID